MTNTTDLDIVIGLRKGDRDAWDLLCQRYSGRVWTYVARMIGADQQAAADVFQESLLAVARAGRGLSADTDRLWPWLASICHRQAALHWRKTYRREQHESAIGPTENPSVDPFDALARQELVESIRVLLAELPSEYAAILTAKYLDDLSVAEIVELMGGTTEGVRSKLARARREFRERYERMFSIVETS